MGLEFDGVNGIIKNTTSDGDVTIKGNDGGSEISLLAFDVSAEGTAVFNSTVTVGSSLLINGTTPTLTIGDAGAEDTKIVFDGNAVDFVVGLDDSADEFRIGVGSGLGSDRVFEINSSGVSTFQKDVHFAGSTPTVTVGDGGAEDAKILFDGNEQNFHIGLDDSTDKLTIGLGNALGTYPAITIDENTNVVIPDSSLSVIGSGNYDLLTITSTDADANSGPVVVLNRDSGSPADNDACGLIKFKADDDGGNSTEIVNLSATFKDVSNGAESGEFNITTILSGSQMNRFKTNAAETVLNDDSGDIDFRVESNGNTHMLFVDAGNDKIGIGTSSPAQMLDISSTNPVLSFIETDQSNKTYNIGSFGSAFAVYDASASAYRLTILTDGSVAIKSTTTDNSILKVQQDTADRTISRFEHHNGSGNNYGLRIEYKGQAPDNNTSDFLVCGDTGASRMIIYSDGDIQNHDNAYTGISDERLKEQIKDSDSQWNDIKAVKVKKFKFKSDVSNKGDSESLWRLGVVAQDLEAAGMNGLVKPEVLFQVDDPDLKDNNVGDIKHYKSAKYSILYMKAIKALQEAQTRIETLETKVAALEG